MKTVAVIEGFTGGPRLTGHFRQALSSAGFKLVKDPGRADIVVAHSAGIYAVPADTKASLLMLIGPNYWPGESLVKRFFRHVKAAGSNQKEKFGWRYFFWTKANQLLYFFTRHKYMWLGIFNNNKLDFIDRLSSNPKRTIIIIRNSRDDYCSPAIREVCKKYGQVRFAELPGLHEDFVSNPRPYIDLILKEL